MPTPELIALARAAATKHALDPALVCAVVERESAWNPHAIRYEPGFRTRYVAPLGLPPTEEIARSISWGLMQVMGQVAREHGFEGKFLSALCDPSIGLDIGCAALASKLAIASSLQVGGSAGLQTREKPAELSQGFSPGAPVADQGFLALSASEASPDTNNGASAPPVEAQAFRPATQEMARRAFHCAASLAACSPPRPPETPGQGIALDEISHALQLWNGGANPNYAAEVLARLPRYQ